MPYKTNPFASTCGWPTYGSGGGAEGTPGGDLEVALHVAHTALRLDGTEKIGVCDTVITAIGQEGDLE